MAACEAEAELGLEAAAEGMPLRVVDSVEAVASNDAGSEL